MSNMQKLSVWGLAFVLFVAGVYVLRDVLLPFVAGIAIAYFLDPLTTRLQKKLHSRIAAVCVVSAVLVLLFVFGMLMVDAEGRRLSFNDNAPPAEMLYQADGKAFLKINAFELDARIPVTGAVKVWRFFEKFFCLPQSSDGEHG